MSHSLTGAMLTPPWPRAAPSAGRSYGHRTFLERRDDTAFDQFVQTSGRTP